MTHYMNTGTVQNRDGARQLTRTGGSSPHIRRGISCNVTVANWLDMLPHSTVGPSVICNLNLSCGPDFIFKLLELSNGF